MSSFIVEKKAEERKKVSCKRNHHLLILFPTLFRVGAISFPPPFSSIIRQFTAYILPGLFYLVHSFSFSSSSTRISVDFHIHLSQTVKKVFGLVGRLNPNCKQNSAQTLPWRSPIQKNQRQTLLYKIINLILVFIPIETTHLCQSMSRQR